jgi:hypothetical protein
VLSVIQNDDGFFGVLKAKKKNPYDEEDEGGKKDFVFRSFITVNNDDKGVVHCHTIITSTINKK